MTTAFERIKQKSLNADSLVAPVSSVSASSTPTLPTSVATSSAFDRMKSKGTAAVSTAPVQQEGAGSSFVKSLVSAPATILARPIQLAAELALPGDNTEAINRFSKDKLGGIVAPVPTNTSDVVKDVGRGVQTVALGTGAPIAGGAAFGGGAALEHLGTDVFSPSGAVEAVVSTAAGAGGGKLLGLIGKPLLNAAGKVVGTITPKIIQDVSAKGAGAVSQFMARHEIVPAAVKPAINAIPNIAEQVDEGVNKLFTGAAGKVKGAVQSQYPGAAKENVAKHYEKIEVDRLMQPTKQSGATFKNATQIANDAKKRNIDIRKLAEDNKIYADDLIDEGKFNTVEVAEALKNEAMSGGKEILRPALAAAEPGVQRVPISTIREQMIRKVAGAPSAKLSPQQKAKFVKKINTEYADDSVTGQLYRDGYSLTNMYDSKLNTTSNIYKNKPGTAPSIRDSETILQKQFEAQVFDDLLKANAPKELGLDKYFKAQEGRFILANYLESLNTKRAPQTLFQRGVRRAAQLGGATTGASVAGPFGMFSGYQFGGIMADTFAGVSNPVKIAFLKSIEKTEPEIYAIMKEFVSKSEIDKLLRPKLNAPTTIFKGPTQQGKPYTPNQLFGTTPVVETKTIKTKKK